MNNNGSNFSLGGLAAVAVIVLAAGLLGGKTGVITVLAVAIGIIVLIVAAVLFFAFKGSAEDAENHPSRQVLSSEDAAILSAARKELTELRVLNARIDNSEIRSVSNQVCGTVEKILKAMKDDPSRITAGQMFLQYYLPTQHKILNKFEQIEESGIDVTELTQKVLAHLGEIRTASEKQLVNIFDNDICDISAEMELMSYSCREDGLL